MKNAKNKVATEEDVIDLKKIPEEVLQKTKEIPSYFYIAFAGELFSVFGNIILHYDSEHGHFLECIYGTGGFYEAFKMTCYKLNMSDLEEYRNTLIWYDCDKFDSIILENVIKQIDEMGNANSYYQYLIRRWDEE